MGIYARWVVAIQSRAELRLEERMLSLLVGWQRGRVEHPHREARRRLIPLERFHATLLEEKREAFFRLVQGLGARVVERGEEDSTVFQVPTTSIPLVPDPKSTWLQAEPSWQAMAKSRLSSWAESFVCRFIMPNDYGVNESLLESNHRPE